MTEEIFCFDCESQIEHGQDYHVGDEVLCYDCKDNWRECYECGEACHIDSSAFMGGDWYCESCSEYFVECHECGDVVHEYNAVWSDWHEEYFCQYCYDESVDMPNVYGAHEHGIEIMKFSRDGRGVGTELELEFDDNVSYVADAAYNGEKYEYFETDGSLARGFETVTHVLDVSQHADWITNGAGATLIENAHHDEQNYNVGLHVNVDVQDLAEDGISDSVKESVYYFVNANADAFKRLGRRYSYHYADFSAPRFVSETGKFTAVNLSKDTCIEFRFFHTVTDEHDYLGSVELSVAIVEFIASMVRISRSYCRAMVQRGNVFEKFTKFVEKNYPEFAKPYMETYLACEVPESWQTLSGLMERVMA